MAFDKKISRYSQCNIGQLDSHMLIVKGDIKLQFKSVKKGNPQIHTLNL